MRPSNGAPISPAYSLVSTDHEKLRHAARTVRPKVVFAQAGGPFARAFATLRDELPGLTFVTVDGIVSMAVSGGLPVAGALLVT